MTALPRRFDDQIKRDAAAVRADMAGVISTLEQRIASTPHVVSYYDRRLLRKAKDALERFNADQMGIGCLTHDWLSINGEHGRYIEHLRYTPDAQQVVA